MNDRLDETRAAERSRWLAELAQTIDQAQALARNLGIPAGTCGPGNELYRQLESVRIEVQSLRSGGWRTGRSEIDPKWMSLFPRAGYQAL